MSKGSSSWFSAENNKKTENLFTTPVLFLKKLATLLRTSMTHHNLLVAVTKTVVVHFCGGNKNLV